MSADGRTGPLVPPRWLPSGLELSALQRSGWCWGVEFNHFLETHRKNRKKENQGLLRHRVTSSDAGNLRPPLWGESERPARPDGRGKPSPSTAGERASGSSVRAALETFALHYWGSKGPNSPDGRGKPSPSTTSESGTTAHPPNGGTGRTECPLSDTALPVLHRTPRYRGGQESTCGSASGDHTAHG